MDLPRSCDQVKVTPQHLQMNGPWRFLKEVCLFSKFGYRSTQEVEIWTFPKGLCGNDITSIWKGVFSVVDLLKQLYLLPKFGDRSPSGKYITAKWNWNFLSYLSLRKFVNSSKVYLNWSKREACMFWDKNTFLRYGTRWSNCFGNFL